MATDPLKALIEPSTGSLSGAWGTAALNVNFSSLGGYLGGSQTISLSSATTFTLTAPAGSITPGGGPSQAENFLLKFTGTLTGNAVITLPLPGEYVVINNCTVGTSYIQFRAVGTGLLTGIPDGQPTKVWCDGTDVGLSGQPGPGTYIDMAVATTPAWFAGCSTLPYLICDGATYSTATYSILGTRLGSTFGGNGITTFAVPDLRARYRIPLDNQGSQGAAGRVTTAGAGINGTTMGAAGGSQFVQQHTHTNVLTDPGDIHTITNSAAAGIGGGPPNPGWVDGTGHTPSTNNSTTSITIANASFGAGSSQNIPPALVACMSLIKT